MKKIICLLLLITSAIGYTQTGVKKITIVNPPAINDITGITTHVSGNGLSNGQISLNPVTGGITNGAGSYTYSWVKTGDALYSASTSTISNLKAGTYTVTVLENAKCSKTQNFIVTEPPLLVAKYTGNKEISCNGGNTTLTASAVGGFLTTNGDYSYNWKITYTDTTKGVQNKTGTMVTGTAGSYELTVSDNASPVNDTTIVINVTENPLIKVNKKTIETIKCKNGSDGTVLLDIIGGVGPYKVLWNDDTTTTSNYRTGLKKGDYPFKIRDALGCEVSDYIYIDEPTADLNVTYTSKQPILTNNNGQITINATGGILPSETPVYKYQWSKVGDLSFLSQDVSQRTDLGNGTYNIDVTSSSGCPFPTITVKLEALNIGPAQQTNIKCFGAETGSLTLNVSGGTNILTGHYTYKWFKNTVEIPGETTETITALAAGIYRVEVSDDETTIDKTYTITTEPSAPLTATHTFTDVVCFGESSGTITLKILGGMIPYTVVWKDVLTGTIVTDPTKLKAGTYSYVITDDNMCTFPSPQNIPIKQNPAITMSGITQKQPTLFSATDGEIAITSVGGTGAHTYILKKNSGVAIEYTTSTITGLGEGVYEVSVKDDNNCTTAIQTITLKALAVTFVNKVDVTCKGANTGVIEVLATGGTPITPGQYTYKWSYKEKATDIYTVLTGKITNKIENLYAGFYKVLVTDNVAVSRELEIAELTERPAITCTFTKTEVNCFNGSDGTITLNIQGGTGDYHVTWNDNVKTKDRTGIPMGDYSFSIIDDNGCSYSSPIPVKITQPLKPLLIASSPIIIDASGFGLQNGSISIVVSDGTFPYTYQWYEGATKTLMPGKTNPLLNGIGANTYTVVVTDKNLCKTEATYTILEPNKLLITAITETESIKCFGYKEAVLKATITGGAPIGVPDATKNYAYRWYNELDPAVTVSTNNPTEPLLAGNYFLEVSDGFGNSFTSNKVVKEPTPVKITFTQTNVSCKNGNDGQIQITTTGGTGAHIITWSITTVGNTNVIDKLYAGNYSVTVRDGNNCTATESFVITEPEILAIKSVVKTPPSAIGVDDASIAVTIQGGTPNYNFSWLDQNKNVIFTDNNQSSNTSIYNIYAGQYFISITDAKGCTIIERDLDKVDPLFISLVQINTVQCYGDATASIKALTSGGLPGYYYKWYNVNNPALVVGTAETLTNAKAGTYYVIATDSFDKSIQSGNIIIAEPTALSNTLSSEYVRCGDLNDWTITSAVSGGTTPYTYLWNTGAKTPNLIDVIPGNYSLIVTDKNGCTITKNITVTAPAHLDASENIKIPTCYAGSDASIVVTTIAGIAPFTYLWNTGETSNTLSNAKAGTYSIEIKDSKGCIISRTYVIENPPQDIINLGEDVTLCFDQTLTINATINDNQATYSWTSDKGFKSTDAMITVSQPATYTVVVTNKLGCLATDSIQISSQQTAISAEFAVSSQVFKNEKIIIVDISNPIPDDVEWILPASAIISSKDKDYAEISFNEIGEHDITLITKKGNCVATQTKTIIVTEGEYENPDDTDLQKKFDLKIYPNPSDGNFTVDVMLDKVMPAHVKVYNLSNNQVIDSKYQEGKDNYSFNFSLSGLPSGIYFVLFESQQGNKLRKIIIK